MKIDVQYGLDAQGYIRCFRGMSIPYARSLPRGTTNRVSRVPGNPKINVMIFQKVVPVACARMPVKLKLAKIQIADAPPSLPVGAELLCADANEQSATSATANRQAQCEKELTSFL
jgi:hypothetical protein